MACFLGCCEMTCKPQDRRVGRGFLSSISDGCSGLETGHRKGALSVSVCFACGWAYSASRRGGRLFVVLLKGEKYICMQFFAASASSTEKNEPKDGLGSY